MRECNNEEYVRKDSMDKQGHVLGHDGAWMGWQMAVLNGGEEGRGVD